ncbi:MAG TPA: alpha/beta fold hydrolase [Hyphomicrobiaceae bacterium]|nr:alpha/beta fold hydrolase [Hyphomicrobiaceae bacterium]
MTRTLTFDVDGRDWPNRATSRFVAAAGLAWHVQQTGQGPEILLIHGTGASTHSFEGLVDVLAPHFSLTLCDLPGHAFTDQVATSDMALPRLAALVGDLLGVVGCRPEFIVGHSAGAAIAARMVIDGRVAPPRLIAGINAALLPFPGVARWLFPPMARLIATTGLPARVLAWHAGREGAVAKVLAGTGSSPPQRSLSFYERLIANPDHVKATLDMMAMWDLDALQRDLPRLSCPLLLIACSGDQAVPAEDAWRVRDICSTAGVRFVRALGHLAHEEDPGLIGEIIRTATADPQAAIGATRTAAAASRVRQRG